MAAVLRLLVVGECGDGKSTLINNLLELTGEQAARANRSPTGTTKEIKAYYSNKYINDKHLVVLDTPGVGDHDITAMALLGMIEAELAARGDKEALDGVIVTSPCTDGKVRLGAQVVQTLVDKGFVGKDRWQNVILVGTKMDRGDEDDHQHFMTAIRDTFFAAAGDERHGFSVLTGKNDVSQLQKAIGDLPSAKVTYEKPAAEVMSRALAGKLGITEESFQEALVFERERAEAAAIEARAQVEQCRLLFESMIGVAGDHQSCNRQSCNHQALESIVGDIITGIQELRPGGRSQGPDKTIQISFAWEDAGERHRYAQKVDRDCEGWMTSALLDQVVLDRSWLPKWEEQLKDASAVLIIVSEKYAEKLHSTTRDGPSCLMAEAQAIIERQENDPEFRVYALDPSKPGHTANDLKELLSKNEREANFLGWQSMVQSPVVDLPGGVRMSRGLAGSGRLAGPGRMAAPPADSRFGFGYASGRPRAGYPA